ncbi:MAG: hypothetical protein LBS18_01740, partial [Clostridiales bacterium]|nr:hypothetical protein [Clostridiales bacterium]
MLCENCGKNEANVHTVSIVNGEKQERHLCGKCAGEAQLGMPSLINLLSGFQMLPVQNTGAVCACGNSFAQFQKTGLLGCPDCYTTYNQLLMPVIKGAQGGRARHAGRRPAEYNALIQEITKAEKTARAQELTAADEVRR